MMPKLKKGEVKTFIKVNGVVNKDPDETWRKKAPIHYCTEQIPTRARIRDWHTGDFVDIGVPEKWNKTEGVISTRFFMPGMGEHHFRNTGMFSLSGDKPADVELYEYLCISPYNESNPHLENKDDIIFKEMNPIADAIRDDADADLLLEALHLAKEMSATEAKEFGAALLWPNYDDIVAKAKVRDYAKQHPAAFIKLANDEATKGKAEIKTAIDKDILDWDIAESTMKMGQTALTKLDIRDGSNYVEAFYEFLQSAANGKDIIKSIRKQLADKKKGEKAQATV